MRISRSALLGLAGGVGLTMRVVRMTGRQSESHQMTWVYRAIRRIGGRVDVDLALRQAVERICGVSADAVERSTTLEELGVDSLSAAELITDVEMRTGRELPVDVLRRLAQVRTVGEVADYMRAALDEPPSQSA
jgi:acyl carrier protein